MRYLISIFTAEKLTSFLVEKKLSTQREEA